jgi:ribose transport system substrate-binding protein
MCHYSRIVKCSNTNSAYLVQSVLRSCDLLRAFKDIHEALSLKQLVERTRLSRPTTFRLLRSLEAGGLIERSSPRRYRLLVPPPRRRRYQIGYATQMEDKFNDTVLQGLTLAASQNDIDLLVLHNRFSPRTALRNVEQMIRAKVDLAVEFQT